MSRHKKNPYIATTIDRLKSINDLKKAIKLSGDASLITQQYIKETLEAIFFCDEGHYSDILYLHYIVGISDNDISEKKNCDPSTIQRHKLKQLKRAAIRLYGPAVLNHDEIKEEK